MKKTRPGQQTANDQRKTSIHLSEEETNENRIRFTQRTIATLQNQKNNERNKGDLTDRRKRWFNQEIEKERKNLRNLIERADK